MQWEAETNKGEHDLHLFRMPSALSNEKKKARGLSAEGIAAILFCKSTAVSLSLSLYLSLSLSPSLSLSHSLSLHPFSSVCFKPEGCKPVPPTLSFVLALSHNLIC